MAQLYQTDKEKDYWKEATPLDLMCDSECANDELVIQGRPSSSALPEKKLVDEKVRGSFLANAFAMLVPSQAVSVAPGPGVHELIH